MLTVCMRINNTDTTHAAEQNTDQSRYADLHAVNTIVSLPPSMESTE